MFRWILIGTGSGILVLLVAFVAFLMWPVAGYSGIPEGVSSERFDIAVRGAALISAGGCLSCHWDDEQGGKPFAGGKPIKTSYGTVYSSNITPDKETGIGNWTDEDFVAAFKHGRRPDGSNLYPAFPYTAYARLSIEEILAIKAYLFAVVKPVRAANMAAEVDFPYGWRPMLTAWKFLAIDETPLPADPGKGPAYLRGQQLVEVLGRCASCHTPTDWLGLPDRSMLLAGTADGPGGVPVPNITVDENTGIGRWSMQELFFYFRNGIKPNYERAKEPMASVINHSLKPMSNADLLAIVAYIKEQPAISNKVTASAVTPERPEGASPPSSVVPLSPPPGSPGG
ncbi:MAG: cytochrome c [Alphaproteobacteria bacterium]|nr:cytochrome c [Alphaproteobacteria bacterium]